MSINSESGQGTTEMVFLIPLLVVLAAGCIFVAYICSQGLKVQEAANVGARIAGEETVGGARDLATLTQDNGLVTGLGVNAVGDPDPDKQCNQTDPAAHDQCLQTLLGVNGAGTAAAPSGLGTKPGADPGGSGGVYWNYRKLIYNLFNLGEQKRLFVPIPTTRDGVSEVRVARVMAPPEIFGWKPPVIRIEAKGYGGEDTYMYSLPRFGRTGTNAALPFWQQLFNGTDGNSQNRPVLKDANPDTP